MPGRTPLPPGETEDQRLDRDLRDVRLACLLWAATATAMLVAPVACHRIMFRRGDRLRIVEMGDLSLLAGLGLLALAMIGAVMLVTDFLFGTTTTVVGAA